MAESKPSGLKAAEEAIKAIKASAAEVSCLFQETFAIRGSKTCSLKCKPAASTNHPFCPNLTGLVPDSQVPENVNCVYEIVVNGLTLEAVKKALSKGLKAAASGRCCQDFSWQLWRQAWSVQSLFERASRAAVASFPKLLFESS